MIKYKPYYFILYGIVMFFSIWLLGPYQFRIYNYQALIYFFCAYGLLFLGSFLFDRPLFFITSQARNYEVSITKRAEKFLIFMVIVSFSALVIYMYEVVNLPISGGYVFAKDDYRDILSINRSTLNKVAEIMMNIGVAIYLITARLKKHNYKATKVLGIVGLFIPAIAILAVGARSRVVTTIGLFVIINALNKHEGHKTNFSFSKLSKKNKMIIFGLISASIYYTLALFAKRGVNDATLQYIKEPSDSILRPIYYFLFNISNGMVGPIYKATWYYTHSLTAFTWSFDSFKTIQIHYGAFLMYLPGYFLKLVGLPFPDFLEIALSSPISGLYSTFITGYFLDWGVEGSLIMIFITGAIFGRISYLSRKKEFSYFILPVILFMCWVSPIYYFLHMGWESVFIWYIIIYIISKKLGLKNKEIKYNE